MSEMWERLCIEGDEVCREPSPVRRLHDEGGAEVGCGASSMGASETPCRRLGVPAAVVIQNAAAQYGRARHGFFGGRTCGPDAQELAVARREACAGAVSSVRQCQSARPPARHDLPKAAFQLQPDLASGHKKEGNGAGSRCDSHEIEMAGYRLAWRWHFDDARLNEAHAAAILCTAPQSLRIAPNHPLPGPG